MFGKMKFKTKKNNRGWIMIVEVFIGILLVLAVLVVSLNNPYLNQGDPYEKFYSIENAILGSIQINNSLRTVVINTVVPAGWDGSNFPAEIKDKINSETPNYLNCTANICMMNESCEMQDLPKQDIYVESVSITTDFQKYDPRKIKLFCWEKV